jgi:hypothetical protein
MYNVKYLIPQEIHLRIVIDVKTLLRPLDTIQLGGYGRVVLTYAVRQYSSSKGATPHISVGRFLGLLTFE